MSDEFPRLYEQASAAADFVRELGDEEVRPYIAEGAAEVLRAGNDTHNDNRVTRTVAFIRTLTDDHDDAVAIAEGAVEDLDRDIRW